MQIKHIEHIGISLLPVVVITTVLECYLTLNWVLSYSVNESCDILAFVCNVQVLLRWVTLQNFLPCVIIMLLNFPVNH